MHLRGRVARHREEAHHVTIEDTMPGHATCGCGCCGEPAMMPAGPGPEANAAPCRCDCGCSTGDGCTCGCADAGCDCGCAEPAA